MPVCRSRSEQQGRTQSGEEPGSLVSESGMTHELSGSMPRRRPADVLGPIGMSATVEPCPPEPDPFAPAPLVVDKGAFVGRTGAFGEAGSTRSEAPIEAAGPTRVSTATDVGASTSGAGVRVGLLSDWSVARAEPATGDTDWGGGVSPPASGESPMMPTVFGAARVAETTLFTALETSP